MASPGCACLAAYPPAVTTTAGHVFVDVYGVSYRYPSAYGLHDCAAFDVGRQPFCSATTAGGNFDVLGNPLWCSDFWCYVNTSACNASASRTSYFPGVDLFYSYATCGAANKFSDYYAVKQPRPPPPFSPPSLPPPPSPTLPEPSSLPSAQVSLLATPGCACLTAYPPAVTMAQDGNVQVDVYGVSYRYPSAYGLHDCAAFDVGRQPFCSATTAGGNFDVLGNPLWCSDFWCYVNTSACNASASRTSYFPGVDLFYSYATCGAANKFSDYYAVKQPRPPPPAPPPSAPRLPPVASPSPVASPPLGASPLPTSTMLQAVHTMSGSTALLLICSGILLLGIMVLLRWRIRTSLGSLLVLALSFIDLITDLLFATLLASEMYDERAFDAAQRRLLRRLFAACAASISIVCCASLALSIGSLVYAFRRAKAGEAPLLDFSQLSSASMLYSAITLLAASNAHLLRLLPWTSRAFDGFPNASLLTIATLIPTMLEDLPQLVLQCIYIVALPHESVALAIASLCLTLTSLIWRLVRRLMKGLAGALNDQAFVISRKLLGSYKQESRRMDLATLHDGKAPIPCPLRRPLVWRFFSRFTRAGGPAANLLPPPARAAKETQLVKHGLGGTLAEAV